MTQQAIVNQQSSDLHAPPLTVSALVPAWNEAAHIGACIESLLAIEEPYLEILVSAGGNDGTREIASEYASDRVLVIPQEPGEGKQRALRKLLALARGDIIYLTDGDSIVPVETINKLLEPIVAGEADVVTGRYQPYEYDLDDPFVLYQWSIDRAVDRHRPAQSEGLSGANSALTRQALLTSGAFDTDVKTGTDYHLARQLNRAGIGIRYVDAAIETQYATNAHAFLNRRARWLRNTLIHGIRSGDLAEIRSTTTTLALGTGVCLFPLSWRWTRRYGIVAWLLGLAFLVDRRRRYARELARERSIPMPSGYYLRLPFYALLDQFGAVRALVDLAVPKWRWRW